MFVPQRRLVDLCVPFGCAARLTEPGAHVDLPPVSDANEGGDVDDDVRAIDGQVARESIDRDGRPRPTRSTDCAEAERTDHAIAASVSANAMRLRTDRLDRDTPSPAAQTTPGSAVASAPTISA